MKYILFIFLSASPLFSFSQLAPGENVQAGITASFDTLLQVGKSAVVMADTVPVGRLKQPLDSLQHKLMPVRLKIDSIKGVEALSDHGQDSLQQILQQKRKHIGTPLENSADLLQLDVPDEMLPETSFSEAGIWSLDLPTGGLSELDLPQESLGGLGEVIPAHALSKGIKDFQLPGLPQEYQQYAGLLQIDSSTFTVENLEKELEEQLLNSEQVASIREQAGISVEVLSTENLQEQLIAQLPDHREQLEKARRELSKYKGRFTEIKSLKDLPKNPLKRHPLMGVCWYKRIQPGLQWQLGQGDALRIDMGPSVSYLLTDKLALGMAGQWRLSIGNNVSSWVSATYDKVWGYGVFGSYEVKRGFYGQLTYERLNTLMQQLPQQQDPPHERLWIEGVRLGLGKRYTLYKNLRGYSLMEYNFTRSLHAPYRQQLQAKVGVMWSRQKAR